MNRQCAKNRAAGASVSHNPGSNLKPGSGIADMRRMLERGVNVAIGTDGAGSSDNLNVFEAMRLASYLSRVQDHPVGRWVSAREAEEAVARLAAANPEARALAEKLHPYVGQFCGGLAAASYHVKRFL